MTATSIKTDIKKPKMSQLHLILTATVFSHMVDWKDENNGFTADVANTHQMTCPPNKDSMAVAHFLEIARNVAFFLLLFQIISGNVKNGTFNMESPLTGTLGSTAIFVPTFANRTIGLDGVSIWNKLEEMQKDSATGTLRQMNDTTDHLTPAQAQWLKCLTDAIDKFRLHARGRSQPEFSFPSGILSGSSSSSSCSSSDSGTRATHNAARGDPQGAGAREEAVVVKLGKQQQAKAQQAEEWRAEFEDLKENRNDSRRNELTKDELVALFTTTTAEDDCLKAIAAALSSPAAAAVGAPVGMPLHNPFAVMPQQPYGGFGMMGAMPFPFPYGAQGGSGATTMTPGASAGDSAQQMGSLLRMLPSGAQGGYGSSTVVTPAGSSTPAPPAPATDLLGGMPMHYFWPQMMLPNMLQFDGGPDEQQHKKKRARDFTTDEDIEFTCPLCPMICLSSSEIVAHFAASHPG
jgi:hypothetical protein